VFGIATTLFLRRRAAKATRLMDDDDPTTNPSPPDEIATIAVDAAHDALTTRRNPGPPVV
jgi:hypothetical protein